MKKEKSPGGNQGLKDFSKDNNGLEEKNQHLLQVNTEALGTFFRALFCNATGGYISLRGFYLGGGVAFNAEGYAFNDPKLLFAANRLATYAASLPAVVFCSPTATFHHPEKAKNVDVFNGVALSVDIDNTHPQKARELLETILGPATLVVASGGEWQQDETNDALPKLHLHWRLAVPTVNTEEHEQLSSLRKLAANIISGDLSAGSPAHPMRLPGSWHTKTHPRMCQILECNEKIEIALNNAKDRLEKYLVEKVALIKEKPKTFPINDIKKPFQTSVNTKYGKTALIEELSELSNAQKGERNNRLNHAAFCLGQLVVSGDLDENYALNSLLTTALCIGLTQSEATMTIQSGLNSGKGKPRTVVERVKLEGINPQKFPFIKAGDLKINPPMWIVEDYLEENSLSVVFGDPGSGKTFIALSLAASISTGRPWNSRNVKQGSVFYIAGEGFSGISRRLAAWSIYHECPLHDAPLFISERPAQFLDRENAKLVAETINELAARHGYPRLIVIDTLARNFGDGDENRTEDMSTFISILDCLIRIPFNCCILIVHHTGHSDKERARGSIALKGAADSEYNIEKRNDTVTMTTTKMKDAEILAPLSFLLKSLEIGIVDEKNRAVTSGVLEPTTFINLNSEKIRGLIPAEGINQSDLLKKMKEKLQIAHGCGGQLLKEGVGKYWSIAKGPRNATIYTPFFSLSDSNEQKTEKQEVVEK